MTQGAYNLNHVLLAFLAGGLIVGCVGMLALFSVLFGFQQRMVLIGLSHLTRIFVAVLVLAPPLLGAFLARRALVPTLQTTTLSVVLLAGAALLCMLTLFLLFVSVMMRSLGLGVHFGR